MTGSVDGPVVAITLRLTFFDSREASAAVIGPSATLRVAGLDVANAGVYSDHVGRMVKALARRRGAPDPPS